MKMENEFTNLTSLQRDILIFINNLEETKTPLEIKEELEKIYYKEIPIGVFLSNLNKLYDNQLLKKEQYNRKTNKYEITNKGKNTIKEYSNFVGE